MSAAGYDFSDELSTVLHRRGDPMTVEDFMSALIEAAGPREELTAGERAFLIDQGGLTNADLLPEAQESARMHLAVERARSHKDMENTALSTAEVATLLGRAASNVRRSRLRGDLYAIAPSPGHRSLLFPRWQFTDSRTVVPGLSEILPAFPPHMHPLSVEGFMTTPREELDDTTAVEWLVGGGPVDRVVSLVEDLAYL